MRTTLSAEFILLSKSMSVLYLDQPEEKHCNTKVSSVTCSNTVRCFLSFFLFFLPGTNRGSEHRWRILICENSKLLHIVASVKFSFKHFLAYVLMSGCMWTHIIFFLCWQFTKKKRKIHLQSQTPPLI